MVLADILASLFPNGHDIAAADGILMGAADLDGVGRIEIIGIGDKRALGVDEAIRLSARVLDILAQGGHEPILVLVDSDSQRMSKRDELLGLNEYLAHLAKGLVLAELEGHRTIGLLYGHTAAGAFIATALATGTLVALPGAAPEVMDLPSMAKVTKLSLDMLREKAKSTPVFAPGLDNLAQTGAVLATWDEAISLADQLKVLLAQPADHDQRDKLGEARGGRPKAAGIAARVHDLAMQAV